MDRTAKVPLNLKERLAYLAALLGKDLVSGLLSAAVFLYCFYVAKVNAAYLGLLFAGQYIVSIVLLPFMGMILDNTKTRFGKYKSFIAIATLINVICIYGLLRLPSVGHDNFILYLAIVYLCWSLSLNVLSLPYWSLLALQTGNVAGRESMARIPCLTRHMGFSIIYLLAIPPIIHATGYLNGFILNLSVIGSACIVIMLVSQATYLIFTNVSHNEKEAPCEDKGDELTLAYNISYQENEPLAAQAYPTTLTQDFSYARATNLNNLSFYSDINSDKSSGGKSAGEGSDRIGFVKFFEAIFRNDQLLINVGATLLTQVMAGLVLGSFVVYCKEHQLFTNPTLTVLVFCGAFFQIISILYFEIVVRHTSRGIIYTGSVILLGIAISMMAMLDYVDQSLPWLMVVVILSNISLGFIRVALTSMTVDTVDYGEFKLSMRTDGIIFSMHSMASLLGSLIGFLLCGGVQLANIVFDTTNFVLFSYLNINGSIIVSVACGLLSLALYFNFYKLNGAFYRNVLNNLQYLRQNQKITDISSHKFMLRYSLDESTMMVKLKAKTEDELIRFMVQKLSEVNAIVSEHDYIEDLNARRAQGPCGIAEGIALPHAKSSAVRRATVVVATLDTPLDLGAIDGRKCDLIFLLASPDDGYTHLNLLGRLSLLLNEPGFADKLRSSGSSTELFERLIQCEKHIVK